MKSLLLLCTLLVTQYCFGFEILPGGFSLEINRGELNKKISSMSVDKNTYKKFKTGGEEQRIWLKDETFIRVSWPDALDASTPSAIIYSTSVASTKEQIMKNLKALGKPDWMSGKDLDKSDRLVWGGIGLAEDSVKPKSDAKFVVNQSKSGGDSITVTLAKPSWFK